jgi:tetratricopeptide (TPR) repeat protein
LQILLLSTRQKGSRYNEFLHRKKPMNSYMVYLCVVAALLCGCATGKFERSLQDRIENQEHLTDDELRRGAVTLRKAVEQDPTNARLNFSNGRVLLATDRPQQALPYFQKAVAINPENADYLFWLGVAYGENKQIKQERASYERALQRDGNYLQALVYLGNNYLNAKAYQSALKYYQRALAISPTNPQALYNRAIIYRHLQQKPNEKLAWRLYLESHPSGELARRAADHLNRLGDFSYRNHRLGPRTVTLPAITFAPSSAELTPSAQAALNQVGSTVSLLKKGKLDILVYQKNNRELAAGRAVSIKRYLEKRFQVLKTEERIRLSWFDVSEKRKRAGQTARIDESVVFLLYDIPIKKEIKARKVGKKK